MVLCWCPGYMMFQSPDLSTALSSGPCVSVTLFVRCSYHPFVLAFSYDDTVGYCDPCSCILPPVLGPFVVQDLTQLM